MKKYFFGLFFSIAITIFVLKPLFINGFFPMHDDTQVGRVVAMGKALRLGQFPVRWVSDLGYGYGYPIFNFYGPLPYYVGGAVYALGMSGLMATKAMFIVGVIIASITMYMLGSAYGGMLTGILASALYALAPYHAIQVYIRGAVGEFWAYAFLPLIVLGIVRNHPMAIAFGIFGVVTSHTITGYITMLVLGIIFLMQKKFRFAILLGLSLSAFFWLPAIVEQSYTNVSSQIGPTAQYSDHFVCVSQLWDSVWGFAGTAPGCVDGISFRLGKPHIALAVLSVVLWGYSIWKRRATHGILIGISIGITILSIYMMLHSSAWVWNIIPKIEYVQYPWRFLTFTMLGISILGSISIMFIQKKPFRIGFLILCIFMLVFVYGKLFTPQTIRSKSADLYESEEELRYRVSKLSDEYLPPALVRPQNVSEIVHDTIKHNQEYVLKTVREADTYGMYRFITDKDEDITIYKAYFPGWVYYINSIRVKPNIQDGLPHVTLPTGESTLEIRFTNTPVRTIANLISFIGWAWVCFYYGKNKKINR